MAQDRNETWAQGSKPGDKPILVELIKRDPRLIAKEEALDRLNKFVKTDIPDTNLSGILDDLLNVLGITDQDPIVQQSGMMAVIRSAFRGAFRRG
ncbi:hypothetical protein LCGC14_2141680 [marine sediment metagenome]|uniref:Uncharacterized protein n=1 Tax=marine sediment metagenome TaxID=412755 RepID=A0A0F9GBG7_9ZZZZ